MLAGEGRHEEAATALARAATKRPDDGELHELLSTEQYQAGRYDAAAAAYQRVIELGRRDAPAYCHLGALLEQASQLEPAWHAFHHAFAADGRNVDTMRRLAAVTHALGRTPEAVQWIQHGLTIAPRDASLRYELAIYYLGSDRRNEAMAEYEIVRQLDVTLATKLYYALGGR